MKGPLLITGANGHLGQQLIRALPEDLSVVALVRSQVAARGIGQRPNLSVRQCNYLDVEALRAAASGCVAVVHLVGIIKETGANSYELAHEQSVASLLQAAVPEVKRIILLSILGADTRSPNRCLASKARSEAMLLGGEVPAMVLRLPMVLGEGDYASLSLAKRARADLAWSMRAQSLEQPIYAGDVVQAILNLLADEPPSRGVIELAGPESLSRADLIKRAAGILGRSVRVQSLPLWLGMAAAWLLERCLSNPPVTCAMLGVLDHDDNIEISAVCQRLRLELTPLDETLRRTLR